MTDRRPLISTFRNPLQAASFSRLIPTVFMRRLSASLLILVAFAPLIALVVLPGGAMAQAADTSPSDGRSQRLLVRALTHLQTGNYSQAIDALEIARGLRPDDIAILLTLADAHRESGDFPAAVYYAETARNASPANDDAALGLAHALVASGDADAAVHLIEAHAHDTGFRPGFAAQAIRLLTDSMSEDSVSGIASDIAVAAIGTHGYHADVLYAAARLPQHNRDLVAEQVAPLLEDQRLAPAERIFIAEWIRDHSYSEVRSSVVGYLPTATRDSPLMATFLTQPPRVLRTAFEDQAASVIADDQELFESGADVWLARIEADPRQQESWEHAVAHLLGEGRAAEAYTIADEATLLFPGNQRLQSLLGMSMLEAGDPVGAVTYLDDVHAAGALALAQVLLDRMNEAGRTLDQVVSGEADLTSSAEQIAYAAIAFAMIGNVPEAIEVSLMNAIRLHPNHVVMLEADAWVLYAADNLAAATEAFEEVTSMGGNLERFRRPLIELYERTNRMDEAAALQVLH